ncbi:uncharacterized protein MAM_06136 [Metarhizium album ARSEF 1941]|uniref:Uncharacterized protein n=1 Tax=Metarhizium album (strain ARSEF 1941) TaxID=1081103 RepID=A0A0B2WJ06_METAS|nr:uncharacterized protein MAM_06136 [Metarhizium album ARSEF 1941]KHN96031.1 hypothetical protein MAM_06136 [Metarhizium album ARSEF 1941]
MPPASTDSQAFLSSLFEELLGADTYNDLLSHPSPRNYLDAGRKLSWGLISQNLQGLNRLQLTADEERKYIKGATDAMCSDTQDILQSTSKTLEQLAWDANWAIVNGFEHFDGIQPQDQILRSMLTRNHSYLLDSLILANRLMQYCADFDNKIVPLCADDSMPPEERLAAVEQLINESSLLQAASILKNWQFAEIHKTYENTLLGKPAATATTPSQYHSPETAMEQLLPEIDFQSWPLSYAASLHGPMSAFIKIGGLLAVGTRECKIVGLLLSAATQPQSKKGGSTRGRPIDIPARIADVERYSTTHRKYWHFTADDGKEIMNWLKDGADMADWPKYMCIALKEGRKLSLSIPTFWPT